MLINLYYVALYKSFIISIIIIIRVTRIISKSHCTSYKKHYATWSKCSYVPWNCTLQHTLFRWKEPLLNSSYIYNHIFKFNKKITQSMQELMFVWIQFAVNLSNAWGVSNMSYEKQYSNMPIPVKIAPSFQKSVLNCTKSV